MVGAGRGNAKARGITEAETTSQKE